MFLKANGLNALIFCIILNPCNGFKNSDVNTHETVFKNECFRELRRVRSEVHEP